MQRVYYNEYSNYPDWYYVAVFPPQGCCRSIFDAFTNGTQKLPDICPITDKPLSDGVVYYQDGSDALTDFEKYISFGKIFSELVNDELISAIEDYRYTKEIHNKILEAASMSKAGKKSY